MSKRTRQDEDTNAQKKYLFFVSEEEGCSDKFAILTGPDSEVIFTKIRELHKIWSHPKTIQTMLVLWDVVLNQKHPDCCSETNIAILKKAFGTETIGNWEVSELFPIGKTFIGSEFEAIMFSSVIY